VALDGPPIPTDKEVRARYMPGRGDPLTPQSVGVTPLGTREAGLPTLRWFDRRRYSLQASATVTPGFARRRGVAEGARCPPEWPSSTPAPSARSSTARSGLPRVCRSRRRPGADRPGPVPAAGVDCTQHGRDHGRRRTRDATATGNGWKGLSGWAGFQVTSHSLYIEERAIRRRIARLARCTLEL
jgi:hypothetical protein